MNNFYTEIDLVGFKMEDFKSKVIGKQFICELTDKTFNCLVKNIIPAQPDNLPFSIVVRTESGQSEEIPILAIKRLTKIE
jgi:hypothetical protein